LKEAKLGLHPDFKHLKGTNETELFRRTNF
jgi:hypothetical protein